MAGCTDDINQERHAFWRAREEELGCPVRSFALGRYLSGREVAGPLWGLLYLTEERFFFHHFPQQNWISALGGGGSGRGGSPSSQEVVIEVPLSGELVLDRGDTPGPLARLLGSRGNPSCLTDPTGRDRPFVFSVEQEGSSLLDDLAATLGSGTLDGSGSLDGPAPSEGPGVPE
ncbi:hypothetical protein AU468_03865 [Alkalispirochaeta sphaeroplastigenens]|uniref:Uncharacterized protein n=1 Tax=Alkalispirochaeta sphaeroplastigenens TaxID=1187066 RepID=A0A2S4JX68_9SPIO|nr:hypothetical protein [Alkalispirochaeta sphaeroplastigenens]POR04118.1 hypothetical protein AU468_03865 [Alkalispirochaeta sphaeroplastigenens]